MFDTKGKVAEVRAPAKINLCLHVGPPGADGYHPVCSLMDRVTLADTVSAQAGPAGEGIRLAASGSGMTGVPTRENLVYRAAAALQAEMEGERREAFDIDIELVKAIPVAAGLGGGSSDAAAILKLLVFLLGLDLPAGRLEAIAAGLGADVPFFLTEGPQLAEGRGEQLTPVEFTFDYAVAIVNPGIPLSTAEVYRKYDEMGVMDEESFKRRATRVREAARGLDSLDRLVELMDNDLAGPARALSPEIARIERDLNDTGAAGVLVSGSGPSVFGVYPGREAAKKAVSTLGSAFPHIWVATPTPRSK